MVMSPTALLEISMNGAMQDAEPDDSRRPKSLWLRDSLATASTPCPRLRGDHTADVAIIGGGYVGLWTAMELKARESSLDVLILEADICGSGASGRNGGYALSWWTKAPSLIAMWGKEAARDLIRKSEAAINQLDEFCKHESIDAQFVRSGWIWGAVSQHQIGAWTSGVEACAKLSVGDFSLLDAHDAQYMSGGAKFRAAVLDRTAALLHPGILVRGMREAALRRGVRIYEHSAVEKIDRCRPARLKTADGSVAAKKTVIATNAWAASVRELARSIVVVSSDIIASRPNPDLLRELDWLDGAGVNDSQQMVHYVRTTRDGRVLAGKGGLATGYGGSVTENLFSCPRRARTVQNGFRELYPGLADIEIDQSWSGPVDRSADGLPLIGALPGSDHIFYGVGWSGNGLAPSQIGAKALASLVLGEKNEWSALPIVRTPPKSMPPEPIRYFGSHIVREAVRLKDKAETHDKSPNFLVSAVAGLAPRGVEDK